MFIPVGLGMTLLLLLLLFFCFISLKHPPPVSYTPSVLLFLFPFWYIFLCLLPIPSLHISLCPLSVISLFGIRHTSVLAEAGLGHSSSPGVTGEQGSEGQRWRDGWRNGGKRKSGTRAPLSLSGSVLSLADLGSDWLKSGASVLPAASVWGLHLERTDITHILTLYVKHTTTQSVDSTCSYRKFTPFI